MQTVVLCLAVLAGACGGGQAPAAAHHPTPSALAGSTPGRTTGCGRPPRAAPGQTAELAIAVQPAVDEGRAYRLHVPAGYGPRHPVPLLLDLHGAGGSAAGEELAGWAARDGCALQPVTFLDTGGVTGPRWEGCLDGSAVEHYRWNGGGHGLPPAIGGVEPHVAMWQFLSAFALPG
jgi:poly(3-hydroxybutyrate) depolymerase